MKDSDLIRRSDVLNLAKNLVFTNDKGEPVFRHICVNLESVRSIPAVDAVEVVRCRECLRAEPHYPGSEFFACELLGTVRKNDYCCYGQRREEAGET